MMRAALAARRFGSSLIQTREIHPSWSRSFSISTGRTADPAVHGGPKDEIEAEEAERYEQLEKKRGPQTKAVDNHHPTSKPAPFASSPTIESSGVKAPLDPTMQQKRHYQVQERRATLEDVSCVGIDGFSKDTAGDDRKRREEDDKEYFKHHKASPLSEVKLADTRKPIRQATDASGGGGVITFKKEQLESAEETMMRATRVWKEVAMKGDPAMPHSKALRDALRARGEYYDHEWELPSDV